MTDIKDQKIRIQRDMIAALTDELLSLRTEIAMAREKAPAVPVMDSEEAPLSVTNYQVQAFRSGFLVAREYYGSELPEDDFDEDEDGGRTFHGAECIRADNPGLICTCNDEEAETTATDLAVNEYPGRD